MCCDLGSLSVFQTLSSLVSVVVACNEQNGNHIACTASSQLGFIHPFSLQNCEQVSAKKLLILRQYEKWQKRMRTANSAFI